MSSRRAIDHLVAIHDFIAVIMTCDLKFLAPSRMRHVMRIVGMDGRVVFYSFDAVYYFLISQSCDLKL